MKKTDQERICESRDALTSAWILLHPEWDDIPGHGRRVGVSSKKAVDAQALILKALNILKEIPLEDVRPRNRAKE